MNYLIDTHILIWASMKSHRLSAELRSLLADVRNEIWFSAISIFEVAIKQSIGKSGFDVDAGVLREAMLNKGYLELPVTGLHGAIVSGLPLLHRDPFDRLLAAQAICENLTLITADDILSRYPAKILRV